MSAGGPRHVPRRWLAIGLAALTLPHLATLALALSGQTIAGLGGPSACAAKVLFGLPCPLCGGTSSWVALWQGHVLDGFTLNPFAAIVFFTLPVVLGLGAAALMGIIDPWSRLARLRWARVGTTLGVAMGFALLASWAWMITQI